MKEAQKITTLILITWLATINFTLPAKSEQLPLLPMTISGYVILQAADGTNTTAPEGLYVYAKENTTIINALDTWTTNASGYYTIGASASAEGTPIDMWVQNINVTRITFHAGTFLELNLTVTDTIPPTIQILSPQPQEIVKPNQPVWINATLTDNLRINITTIKMTLNQTQLMPTFDPATGLLSYQTGPLIIGLYIANITVKDIAANTGVATWNFTAAIAAPTAYAEFTANVTNGTEPLTVTFMDQSLYFDTITSRTWDFGDGNITTTIVANITHSYIQNGTYTVSLTVNGTQAGQNVTATETKTDYITVYDTKPKADFYAVPTNGTVPLTVKFYDNTTHYDNITSWIWNFGDGTNSTEQNPTHNYTTTGTYNVTLTITEQDGDNDTITKENYITVQPTAPIIEIISPTTANPVYTQSNKTIQITLRYTEPDPLNGTLKIYNATYTVLLITNETVITPGTNITVTANITIPETAPDGKYDLSITMFNTYNLSTTATQTNAIIIDSTPPSIGLPYQEPPGQTIQPNQTVNVDLGLNVTVRVNVTDATSGVKQVILSYTYNVTATQWANITMQPTTGNEYNATIPSSQLPISTTITYYITATDNTDNTAKTPTNGIYFQYHVIPEFTYTLAILLTLLAFAALIAITKRKEQRLSR